MSAADKLGVPAPSVPVRLVSVDHPDRSSSFPTRPIAPVFLRVDHAHELPLIAMDELGREVARFRHLADLAHYLRPDGEPATLPFPIVRDARGDDGEQLSFAMGEAQGAENAP